MVIKTIMEEKSFYGNALVAKRSKKFGASTLDFLLVGILSVLLYALTNLVIEALPDVKATQSDIALIQGEMKSLIKESKIGEEKGGSFVGIDTLAKNYVYRLTHASLLNNGIKENDISSSISNLYPPIAKESDNAYSYYVDFKESHLSEYEEKGIYGLTNYLDELSKDMPFAFSIENDYPYLKLEQAKQIQDYIVNRSETYEPGKNAYEALFNRYSALLKDGANDFQDRYIPYKEKANKNETYKIKIYAIRRGEILFSYFVAVFLGYFLFPLLLKNGKSLAMKSLSLGYVDEKGRYPKWWKLLIHASVLFFEESVLMMITPFVVYGGNAIDLVYLPFLGDISLLWVGLFSILFMLFSFLSSFIDKEKKATTSEIISQLVLKDGKEFIVEDSKENNGRKL